MNLSGNPIDYVFAFFGGVLVSFTPCVYPLIPVSAGYIGARSSGAKLRGLALSLAYVTGIAVTYAALGLTASLTGKIFGAISSYPLTYIIVGSIIVIFGLSMSGLFVLKVPVFVNRPGLNKQNYFSIFFLGLASGLIIGPCTTPVLGAILLYLATKKNLFYGATLLFTFAYGMGLLLILIGTFSSVLVNRLPKSGWWMAHIQKAGAFILIGFGLFLVFSGIKGVKN